MPSITAVEAEHYRILFPRSFPAGTRSQFELVIVCLLEVGD
jgi:hypothetical protein